MGIVPDFSSQNNTSDICAQANKDKETLKKLKEDITKEEQINLTNWLKGLR